MPDLGLPTHAEDAVDSCARRLRRAFAREGERAARLAQARTTVRMRCDESDRALTLLLDRNPPVVTTKALPAEIELTFAPEQFDALGTGALTLQEAIMSGRATYAGPVRKLLGVWPVLLTLVRDAAGAATRPPAASQPGAAAYAFREHADGDFFAFQVDGVSKRLGGRDILDHCDLAIPEGLIAVVLGPSGTGKSVLLKHLVGLMRPDTGDVLVRGESLAEMSLGDLLALRRKIGVLFQDGALWGSMNVFDNVALPLRQHTNLTEREIADAVHLQLRQVGLGDAARRMPSELSGGMRKRAGFARALVLDPEIVLFDEPDSGLDPVRTALLCDLIARTHGELGGTYLIVTHDLSAARRIADYLVLLWQGRVVASGPTDAVASSSDPFVRQFLAGSTAGPLGME